MKIIYLKNNGGCKKGDIKEVAEGHARNFLIPQGLAVLATSENISRVKKELDKKEKTKIVAVDQAKIIADKINGKRIEIRAKANKEGKLYAAISEVEVKTVLKKQGFNIGEAKIVFPTHIKEAGDFTVTVDFGSGISSTIIILVRV